MPIDLNPDQDRAARATRGRVVALAGPGSGKTRTAVERIRRMLDSGENPSSMVVITFTTKGAGELTERLDGTTLGFVGTIHSLARHVLELCGPASGLRPGFSVWDELDRSDVLRQLVKARLYTNLSAKIVDETLARLHRDGQGSGSIAPWFEGKPGHSRRGFEIAQVIEDYRTLKVEANAEDFDGLIDRARRALVRAPLVLNELQNRWRHFTVDEVQDNNRAQDALLELLRPSMATNPVSDASIIRIGDPLQSLYRWRGAAPELIGPHVIEANTRVVLRNNYRSGSNIVSVVDRLARRDPAWTGDSMIAQPDRGAGDVSVNNYRDPAAEARQVASAIATDRMRYGDQAVLARNNSTLARMEQALKDRGVPTRRLGASKVWLHSPEVRAWLAHLRLGRNTADELAFRRAFTHVLRPSHAEMDRVEEVAAGRPLFSGVADYADAPPAWAWWVDRVQAIAAAHRDGFTWNIPALELLHALQEFAEEVGLAERVALLERAERALTRFAEAEGGSVGSFLWWLLDGAAGDEEAEVPDAVTLSTIHLAKGLEFPRVWLVSCVEGKLPSAQALSREAEGDRDAIVDELRCFYVAASRARDDLRFSWYFASGSGEPTAPSRFLDLSQTPDDSAGAPAPPTT